MVNNDKARWMFHWRTGAGVFIGEGVGEGVGVNVGVAGVGVGVRVGVFVGWLAVGVGVTSVESPIDVGLADG